MFLITTAEKQFWKKNKKILFLGEWCKTYENKSDWENLDYKLTAYHWDDRKKLYQDYLKLEKVYERYLSLLADKLNNLHNVNHCLRYWRIIIGPWLHYFIAVFFDRYSSLKKAKENYYITNTVVTNTEISEFIPQQMFDFIKWFCSDMYNHILYSYIIKKLNLCPYELTSVKIGLNNTIQNADGSLKNKSKEFIRYLLNKFSKFTNPSYLFCSSYMGQYNQAKLEIALGQFPTRFYNNTALPHADPDLSSRKLLVLNNGKNEFEKLLDDIIPKQIPRAYIENYQTIKKIGESFYPKKLKLIYTANSHNSDEVFKIYTAECIDKEIRFLSGQHGGLYGTGLWFWLEEHEKKITDKYITWGWRDKNNKKVKQLSSIKLFKVKKIKPKITGDILWVLSGFPKYSYHMYSAPVASQFLDYLDEQIRFAKELFSGSKELILLRYYPHNYGWGERKQIEDSKLGVRSYYGKKNMYDQVKQSRLFIGTYNATTYLETFAANFPTIIFWNPYHWELRDSAKPYFTELKKSGIFHDTPESAAKKVNEIYKNPEEWWNTDKVQEAKNNFCKEFANTSDNWVKEWKIFFRR